MKVKFLVVATAAVVLMGAGCNYNSAANAPAPAANQSAVTAPAANTPAVTPPAQTTATVPSTAQPRNVAVTISNYSFSPNTITIKKGDSVTWTNDDPMPHTISADDNSFKSDYLSTGQSFNYTFNQAGTFGYHCSVHPSMKATVVVE